MTTRDEIIALAYQCGFAVSVGGNGYWDRVEQLESFYQAAQRQAYERAEKAARDAWFQSTCHISDIEDAIRALIEGDPK